MDDRSRHPTNGKELCKTLGKFDPAMKCVQGNIRKFNIIDGERVLKQEADIAKLKQDVCNVEVRCKKREKAIDFFKSNR